MRKPDKDIVDAFKRGLGSPETLKKKKIWLQKILRGKKESFILEMLKSKHFNI